MTSTILQLIISLAGILGAGMASFYGAKISIARVEEKIAAHRDEIAELKRRLDRLETPHFGRGHYGDRE